LQSSSTLNVSRVAVAVVTTTGTGVRCSAALVCSAGDWVQEVKTKAKTGIREYRILSRFSITELNITGSPITKSYFISLQHFTSFKNSNILLTKAHLIS
jgi:hypothetical protein